MFMASLGCLGNGDIDKAKEYAQKGLELDKYHCAIIKLTGKSELDVKN